MIRREETDSVWVIHQTTHAYIAGQIGAHWIGSERMEFTPREELLIAAYAHDSGWTPAEQQPRVNRRGLPRTFTEMNLDEHFQIWQHSIDAVFIQNRYAGLLTSLHCTALYEQRLRYVDDAPEDRQRIKAFLQQRYDWQKALIAALTDHPRYALAVQPDRLAENLRLLQVWDYLSLLLCMSAVHEQVLEDVPLGGPLRQTLYIVPDGPRGMALAPFPLDGPLTIWIDARQILGAPFDSDAALRQGLAATPYKPLVFEIRGE